MIKVRARGFTPGTSVSMDINNSGVQTESSFLLPGVATALPRINSTQAAGDTLTLDTTGLTGMTAYDWRDVDADTSLGTLATFDSTGHMGKHIACVVTCDQGVLTSPAVHVYMQMAMASMNAEDAADLALLPHHEATHIMTTSGLWSLPTNWLDGEVPGDGARVLIAYGVDCDYDVNEPGLRLDQLRVDGRFRPLVAAQTAILVETIIIARGGVFEVGTQANRVSGSFECIYSDRHYPAGSVFSTDIDMTRDPQLRGRGMLCHGLKRVWGAFKTPWVKAAAVRYTAQNGFEIFSVASGDTSIVLKDVPVGWSPGDTIIIGGTGQAGQVQSKGQLQLQDEERVIATISGDTVTFTDPLVHDHDNQNPQSNRIDLTCTVMLKAAHNVTFRSERTNIIQRRAHQMISHPFSEADIWSENALDLGRTDKSKPAGKIENGMFTAFDEVLGDITEPLTAESNLAGRYSEHFHLCGYGTNQISKHLLKDSYIEGSPGLAVVHHEGRCDIDNNVAYKFFGSGFVSESGNEVGSWSDNVSCHTTCSNYGLEGTPKTRDGVSAKEGDIGKNGFGFFFRSRVVRSSRNIAISCAWGFVFQHRWQFNILFPIQDPLRSEIGLGEAGLIWQQNATDKSKFSFVNAPINHFAGNEACATIGGFFVTKLAPISRHDVNVHLTDFTSWGFTKSGAILEYVNKYALDRFTCVGLTDSGTTGINIAANAFQMSVLNASIEGCENGIMRSSMDVTGQMHDNHDPVNKPRWALIGSNFVNCGTNHYSTVVAPQDAGSNVKTADQVTMFDDDWDGTRIDRLLDPILTFPDEIGSYDYNNVPGDNTAIVTNADGVKQDNVSNAIEVQPSAYNEESHFPIQNDEYRRYADNIGGYYTYNGNDVLVFSEIHSDTITARPAKRNYIITLLNAAGTNFGPYVQATTDVVASDVNASAAQGGSVTVNVLSGVSGAGGAGTYSVDAGDEIKPQHGEMVVNHVTGDVTYTPDRNFIGTDEMYVFVESQGRYATVRISVVVGAFGTVQAPIAGSDFTITDDADPGMINVNLATFPDTGGRAIYTVQYTTDSGTTWRRLCHGWPVGDIKVDVDSTGTAIAAGSYGVSLRYQTDHDLATSPVSAETTVTV